VQLSRLTEDVFSSFRLAAATKGIELVNKTAGLPTLLLDGHRIRQILFNLIGNAVKFTKRGSVTVSASYDRNHLNLSVSDTGCGIPSDKLAHILDPFVQVHDPSHSADRSIGTGLGLSICRSLVEMMGGELVVESGRRSRRNRCKLSGRRLAKVDVVVAENAKNAVTRTEYLADARRLAGLKHCTNEGLVNDH
jgi:signal transduction histidine kinase